VKQINLLTHKGAQVWFLVEQKTDIRVSYGCFQNCEKQSVTTLETTMTNMQSRKIMGMFLQQFRNCIISEVEFLSTGIQQLIKLVLNWSSEEYKQ
jgi:hypothetical protein